jgi:hypothetical protein
MCVCVCMYVGTRTHARAHTLFTIDCAKGFHQILVKANNQPKTAFSMSQGNYEYKMLFGLGGAPSTSARLMSTVLAGIQGIKCLVNLDDIIFGETLHRFTLRN